MSSLFGEIPSGVASNHRQRLDVALLHRMGCKACPLASLPNLHPDMPASGSEHPLVYILGEGPGKQEDEKDEQFVGESGKLLRARIPKEFKNKVRFNNVVRTRPDKNDTPGPVEIECCRPSIIKDIERTKPRAIFGFGNVPLEWVMGGATLQGVTMWRGRRMPVKVGNHTCWYYPMLHPSWLLRQRGKNQDAGPSAIGSEDERMFVFDIQRAFAELDDLPEPKVHTPKDVWAGLDCISVAGKEGIRLIEEGLDWAFNQPYLGLDYETNRLRPYERGAKILTASLATALEGFAFPFRHRDAEWSEAELATVEDLWVEFLRTYKGVKFVHHLAFELEWTGVKFFPELIRVGKWEDTSVQASILDERKGSHKPGCFSLEFLVQQYFGFNLKKLSNLDRKNLDNVPVEVVLRYNGGDSKYHCALGLGQRQRLVDEGLHEVYVQALRRVPTVVLTQMKGVPVDQKEVHKLQDKYDARIEKTEKEIAALPVMREFEKIRREKFKPFSNPDVLFAFKDILNCEECKIYDKKKKADRYSTDESVLEKIDHPLATKLLYLRKANKRRSTYIDPLDPENVDEKGHPNTVIHPDGLVHFTLNTIFAETGRLSAQDPNLQNFPKRDGEAKEVRKQVKAPPGCSVVTFDYGQIEARVIALFTKDPVFVKALWENYDVHTEWAERLVHAYPKRVGGKKNFTDKKVMKDFRTDIKNQWTFPLFFGATLQSASGYLDIPEEILEPEYNRFWKIFATTKDWQEDELTFYRKNGYVECLTGRRRRGPLSVNKVYNSPVQGTAAELVMDGMSRLSEIGDPELQPEINIHDDLTYCRVPNNKIDDFAERVITEMLDVPFAWAKGVPITVEMSVGPDWLNLKEIGTFSSNTWFK